MTDERARTTRADLGAAETCAIARAAFASDHLAGARLRAELEAAIAVSSPERPAVCALGPGTYRPDRTITAIRGAGSPGSLRIVRSEAAGANPIIDGGGEIPLFSLANVTLVIDGVDLANGAAGNRSGGAIFAAGPAASLTVRNAAISGCSALQAGAIRAETLAEVALEAVTITGCSAQANGGALLVGGGTARVSLTDVAIDGCRAATRLSHGDGSGIHLTGGPALTCRRAMSIANGDPAAHDCSHAGPRPDWRACGCARARR